MGHFKAISGSSEIVSDFFDQFCMVVGHFITKFGVKIQAYVSTNKPINLSKKADYFLGNVFHSIRKAYMFKRKYLNVKFLFDFKTAHGLTF